MKIKDLPKIDRQCALCGKKIKVIIYSNGTYRGGHYFGKIPLYRKAEMTQALKVGTRITYIGEISLSVLKKDPKPYAHAEYWECPTCYWKN